MVLHAATADVWGRRGETWRYRTSDRPERSCTDGFRVRPGRTNVRLRRVARSRPQRGATRADVSRARESGVQSHLTTLG
jgi:hypothetical protein